jgi:uncharacterized protein (TIGR00645 family)
MVPAYASNRTYTRPKCPASLIFFSRWLQAPLYLGLIVAQGVYVYHFLLELAHLVQEAPRIDEKTMLTVLGLIDVVMIATC